jgi:antitoxin component YwqK of YwqJK toxin-antitoxin module
MKNSLVLGVTLVLFCLTTLSFAQHEQHTGRLLSKITSFDQERISRLKIQALFGSVCGTNGQTPVLECRYDLKGRLVDSIGYATGWIRELFNRQANIGLPFDSTSYVGTELISFRYQFTYNDKDLRTQVIAHTTSESRLSHLPVILNVSYQYTYDAADRVISMIGKSFTGITVQEDTYTYDAAGNIIQWKQFKSGSPRNFTCYYTFDAYNHLTEYKRLDGNGEFSKLEKCTYDINGRIQTWADYSKLGLCLYKKEFQYDGYGNLTLAMGYIDGTDFDSQTKFTYDADGKLIETTTFDGPYGEEGAPDHQSSYYERDQYDAAGNLVRQEQNRRVKKEDDLTVYDESGNIVRRDNPAGGCVVFEYSYYQ